MITISKRIKELRTEVGITQVELAEKIGVNQATIANYEKNRRHPDIQTIKKLCDCFEVSADYLLGFSDY